MSSAFRCWHCLPHAILLFVAKTLSDVLHTWRLIGLHALDVFGAGCIFKVLYLALAFLYQGDPVELYLHAIERFTLIGLLLFFSYDLFCILLRERRDGDLKSFIIQV